MTHVNPESKEIEIMSLQHDFKVQDKANDNEWKSCCGKSIDSRAVVYFTQIGIISGIMLFNIYQLTTLESCESQSVYIGLLTMLIGVLCPNPKFVK
jgi:hypothetical protein